MALDLYIHRWEQHLTEKRFLQNQIGRPPCCASNKPPSSYYCYLWVLFDIQNQSTESTVYAVLARNEIKSIFYIS